MKKIYLLFGFLCLTYVAYPQSFNYEPSKEHPYGQLNPEAPAPTGHFAPLIGKSNCLSVARISQSEWADTVNMQWVFKYIMDGKAVQDETLKADGKHSGSIRQYNADSSKWYVHYYSSAFATPVLSSWEGNKNEKGNIVLYRDQKAPNGADGYFRLTFSNISDEGFDWAGEWVDLAETIVYPTWKIFCTKQE
ncbi:MAG: hypothetical protein AAFX87_29245 [Bacteroidota bacterium]